MHQVVLPLILVAFVFSAAAPAQSQAVKNCQVPIQKEIEQIQDRMRRGYKAAEGERLRQRLRELNSKLYECRNAR